MSQTNLPNDKKQRTLANMWLNAYFYDQCYLYDSVSYKAVVFNTIREITSKSPTKYKELTELFECPKTNTHDPKL